MTQDVVYFLVNVVFRDSQAHVEKHAVRHS